jgi:hypothetical protein
MHDRLALPSGDRAVGSFRMPPVGTGNVFPPVAQVARPHRTAGHPEYRATRLQRLRPRTGVERRVERPLGERNVTGGGDERSEVGVGDRVAINPVAIDRDAVRRPLLGIGHIRSHAEGAALNLGHGVGRIGLHPGIILRLLGLMQIAPASGARAFEHDFDAAVLRPALRCIV